MSSHRCARKVARRAFGGEIHAEGIPDASPARLAALTHGMRGTWTTSGRGALGLIFAQLKASGIDRIFLPAYLCRSILIASESAGLRYSFYPVDENLNAQPEVHSGAGTLVIDYFGWRDRFAAALSNSGSSEPPPVIEDACQALLSSWRRPCAHNHFLVLSPRKYAPIGMGGWCNVKTELSRCPFEVENMAWRSISARLLKAEYMRQPNGPIEASLERFYVDVFREVEAFMDQHPEPLKLPSAFCRILASTDWETIARKRRDNWSSLHRLLDGVVEPLFDDLPDFVVPLGYVIRYRNRDGLLRLLARRRVFAAVHWPLPEEVSEARFPEAVLLSKTCLTLPIDQRYGATDMEYVADVVRELV